MFCAVSRGKNTSSYLTKGVTTDDDDDDDAGAVVAAVVVLAVAEFGALVP